MKKIIVFALILVLMSSIVSALDLTGGADPSGGLVDDSGGTGDTSQTISFTHKGDLYEVLEIDIIDIGTFTADSNTGIADVITGYQIEEDPQVIGGKADYDFTILRLDDNQNTIFVTQGGGTLSDEIIDFNPQVNKVDMVIQPAGGSARGMIALTGDGLPHITIFDFTVIWLPPGAVPGITTGGFGGGIITTTTPTQQDVIESILNLIPGITQEEAGRLSLRYLFRGDRDSDDLLEDTILTSINQNEILSFVDSVVTDGDFDGVPEGVDDDDEDQEQKKLGKCKCSVKQTVSFTGCTLLPSTISSPEPGETPTPQPSSLQDVIGGDTNAEGSTRPVNIDWWRANDWTSAQTSFGQGPLGTGAILNVPINPDTGHIPVDESGTVTGTITCSNQETKDLGECDLATGECPPDSGTKCDNGADSQCQKSELGDEKTNELRECINFVVAHTSNCLASPDTQREGACEEAAEVEEDEGGADDDEEEVGGTTYIAGIIEKIEKGETVTLTPEEIKKIKSGVCDCQVAMTRKFLCQKPGTTGLAEDGYDPTFRGQSGNWPRKVSPPSTRAGVANIPLDSSGQTLEESGLTLFTMWTDATQESGADVGKCLQFHYGVGPETGPPTDMLSGGMCEFRYKGELGNCDPEDDDCDIFCEMKCYNLAVDAVNNCAKEKEEKCDGDFKMGDLNGVNSDGYDQSPLAGVNKDYTKCRTVEGEASDAPSTDTGSGDSTS